MQVEMWTEGILVKYKDKYLSKWWGHDVTKSTWEPKSSFTKYTLMSFNIQGMIEVYKMTKEDKKLFSLGKPPNFEVEKIICYNADRKKFCVKHKGMWLETYESFDYVINKCRQKLVDYMKKSFWRVKKELTKKLT